MNKGLAFEQILDSLYEGIIDPAALENALKISVAEIDASGVNIHVVSKDTLENLFFAGYGKGYTDESITAYLDHWQYVNAHRDAMRRAYAPGQDNVFLCHEHISDDDWAKGAYFQNFFSGIGQRWLAGGIAWNGQHTEVSIAFSRAAGAEPFDEDAREFLKALLPHVRRAARLALKLGAPGNNATPGVNNALAAARAPSFLVDAEARLKWMNTAGAAFIESSSLFETDKKWLVIKDKEDGRTLSRLIANAVDKRLAETPLGSMRIGCLGAAVELDVMPATIPAGALIDANALALVMARPIGLPPSIVEQLQNAFNLTGAEGRIAVDLAEGASVEEIAAKSSLSQHTVRTHLRSVFAKTGVNRQSALAALIWKTA